MRGVGGGGGGGCIWRFGGTLRGRVNVHLFEGSSDEFEEKARKAVNYSSKDVNHTNTRTKTSVAARLL